MRKLSAFVTAILLCVACQQNKKEAQIQQPEVIARYRNGVFTDAQGKVITREDLKKLGYVVTDEDMKKMIDVQFVTWSKVEEK